MTKEPLAVDFRRPVLCLVMAAVLSATGCASHTADEGTGPIVFADGKDTSSGEQIKSLVRKWNAQHPGETVTMVELPESTDDHRAQLIAHAQDAATAASGADNGSGCYDVVTIDVIWTAEFAKWGYIEALDPDDFDHESFLKRQIESVQYHGKLWAIPLRSDVGLLYYRKDVLDEEGVQFPRSWSELRRQAMTIAPKHELYGYVSQLDRYEGFTVNALESIWGNGGNALSRDGEVLINSPIAKAGFRRLLRGFQEKWIPSEAMDFNEEGSRIVFQDKKALFLRNWTYAYQLLDGNDSPVKGKFGVAPLPGQSALGGWNLALSRCSKRRKTARDFMRFLTSEESQRALFKEAAFAPSRKALYQDPALQREFPHLQVLRKSIEDSRNRPVTPYYNQVSTTIQADLYEVLAKPWLLDTNMTQVASDLRTAAAGR